MDIKEMIKVMQHFADGGKVEWTNPGYTNWEEATSPCWDWLNYNYRIQPPKIKQPLSAADFPPGTAIRSDCDHWFAVLYVNPTNIMINVGKHLSFEKLLTENWEYSTDGGRTWKSCYEEI